MSRPALVVHGPTTPGWPRVLDSPHSGFVMPADFASVRTAAELRDGEDCIIDELYLPATARGVPLLAAQFPRTTIDANRHGAGIPRADFVLGDRDGTSCAPAFTAFVHDVLVGLGHAVRANDPFKGVELVRAYALIPTLPPAATACSWSSTSACTWTARRRRDTLDSTPYGRI